MTKKLHEITIEVPEEFLELCQYDRVCPADVLRGFVADLCGFGGWRSDLYVVPLHLSSDRDRAWAYYDHAYAWNAQWMRENVPLLDKALGGKLDRPSPTKEIEVLSENPGTHVRLPHN